MKQPHHEYLLYPHQFLIFLAAAKVTHENASLISNKSISSITIPDFLINFCIAKIGAFVKYTGSIANEV